MKGEQSMTKINEIQGLVKQLNEYRHEYYNLNSPSVSDLIYDKLFDKLQSLEIENNYILSNSPTQSVGYEVKSKLQKRTHPTLLKSLHKTKFLDEINKWKKDKDCILMLKADGLTVEVNYENGALVGAYTRGNGEIGEDIFHNAKTFQNIPLTIPFLGKIRTSGEAIIHRNDFEKINNNLTEEEKRKLPNGKYATPRNLVAGSVRQLDSKICATRNVYFYAFNILEAIAKTRENPLNDSKYENFKWLGSLGFWTIGNMVLTQDITRADIDNMKECAKELNIPIDGMVLSFDSIKYSNTLLETSHHPLHSIAFKEKDETEETVLREVEWNTTRSGQINPTAKFDTVLLDNTDVSRASLFNLTFIEDMQLNIGSRIMVSKRNMIIPYIEENLDIDNGILDFPDDCPSCGFETLIKNTGTAEFLYCSNDKCPAKILDTFVNFVKRDAMNVDGLSEATLSKLIDKGFIKTFADIYKLEQYKSQIVKMEGFGLKSYQKLIDSIEKSKSVSMASFVLSLGIDQVGKGGAKRLAKHFNNDLDLFFEAIDEYYDFSRIEDFGQITADALYKYFKDEENMNQVNELLQYITIKQEEKKGGIALKSLEGLAFVVTGNVTTFKNRKELEELITSLQGKLNSSVSKNTNYLINNDTTSTSGKNQKAMEIGVPIISEEDFNTMIGRS